ncbi:MAG: efflux RND transporter permease subunit, partial [Syntrophales bacterium]|nr:efflux RND transporter permease subunit [Syntrophales bacterium]
ERLEGVASVYIMGGLEREINIFVDRDKLSAFNISVGQIIDRLARENVNVSGGHVEKGNTEYLVRTMGEYKDIEAIRNTVVTMHGNTSVYVKDVANVTDTFKEIRNYGRTNKKPSVIMMVMKQSGKNTVTVIDNVKETLVALKGRIPADIAFYPVMDQGRLIKRITRNTGSNAAAGAILAIIMVFVFLWNWRPTITIGLAVPLSIITTAIGIYAFDYTLNIMTLGGMALGVGMLVDNAVVVIENIFRHMEEGKKRSEASIVGTQEVGMAITASTLTTISVFLPMALAGGIAGRLARPLAVTITMALLASLFVAVTIVPMLSSVFFKIKQNDSKVKKVPLRLFSRIQGLYVCLLRWSLGHRLIVISVTVLLLVISLSAIPLIGTEFMPKGDFPILALKAELPVGTSLEETNRIIKRVENTILNQPETIFLASFIGLSRESKFDIAWGTGAADVNEALLYARLADKEMRVRSAEEIRDYVRKGIPKIKGAKFDFYDIEQMMMGSTSGSNSPVAIKVFGKDLQVLKSITDTIAEKIESVEGLRDIDTTLKMGKPELQIIVDREKASRMGLTVGHIAETIKAAMLGVVPTKYRIGGDEFNIRVRFRDLDRQSIEDVGNATIATPSGERLLLYQLADIVPEKGPVKIFREDQERKVTVTANTYERDIGSIIADIKEIEKGIRIPEGYFIEYGGTYKDMKSAFSSLFWALVVSIVLIYMIMAAQFESLRHPLVIMFTVPLSFIGVVFGLLLFHKTLSVPAFMGVIILAGVVVNNGIVMIDYINRLRKRGMDSFEAVIEGASVRLRPILITSFTTVFGMLPMAFSQTQGSELRSPMAIAVAAGLVFSTLLTLFVIPVVYSLFDRIRK